MTFIKIKDIHGCNHLINLSHIVSFSKEAGGYVAIHAIDQRAIKVNFSVDECESLILKNGLPLCVREDSSWAMKFPDIKF